MKNILMPAIAALLLFLTASCQETVLQNEGNAEDEYALYTIRVTEDKSDNACTRSVFIEDDDYISSICAMAFDAESGELLRYKANAGDNETGAPVMAYIEGTSSFQWTLPIGTEMDIYAVCNMGEFDAPDNLSDFMSLPELTIEINDVSELNSTGIPMTAILEGVRDDTGGATYTLTARRIVSRYSLGLSGKPDGYNVTGVRICNVNSSTRLFASNEAADENSTLIMGDWATPEDIAALNSNGRVDFHMFENAQTTARGVNLVSGLKWHEVHAALGDKSEYCTYLDIVSEYEGASRRDRLYLGKDCTSNLDVLRNTICNITCPAPTDVTSGAGQDALAFTGQAEIIAGLTQSISFSYNLSLSQASASDIIFSSDHGLTTGTPVFSPEGTYWGKGKIPVTCSSSVSEGDVLGLRMTCGEASAEINLEVYDLFIPATTYDLTVSPESLSIEIGEGQSLTAMYYVIIGGISSSGTDVTGEAVWHSDDESIAAVSSAGYVTGISEGETDISAEYNGHTAKVHVTVGDSNVYSGELILSESSASIQEGTSANISASYRSLVNGTVSSTTDVTSSASWTTSDSSTATVSGGKVTGINEGTATVTATYNGYSASAEITVSAKPVTYTYGLEISPSAISIQEGGTGNVSVSYITYADGTILSEKDVTSTASWTTSDASTATVSGGTVSGINEGTATVTATYNGYSASAEVTVGPSPVTLEYIVSDPSAVSGYSGDKSQVTVSAHYSDGNIEDISSVCTWSSSSNGIATYSAGQISHNGAGTAVITFSYEGHTATTEVTVNPVGPAKIGFDTHYISLEAGETYQVTVLEVLLNNGKTAYPSASELSWESSAPSCAAVTGGLITGIAGGTATITGTYTMNGISASKDVSVTVSVPEVVSVAISGYSYVSVAGSIQLKATATYSDGTTRDVTSEASWYSRDGYLDSTDGGTVCPSSSSAGKSDRVYCQFDGVWSDDHSVTVVNNVISINGWMKTEYGINYFGMEVTFADGSAEETGFSWEVTYDSSSEFIGMSGSAGAEGQSYSTGSNFAKIKMVSDKTFTFLTGGTVISKCAECYTTISHSDNNL